MRKRGSMTHEKKPYESAKVEPLTASQLTNADYIIRNNICGHIADQTCL